MRLIRLFFVLFALALPGRAQDISSLLSVQEHQVGTNTLQRYFLIEHKSGIQTNDARGLVLILPGGPGSADFLPFCANVLTLYGIPTNFVTAELVAPQWSEDENRVVWPGRAFPDPQAKFTSEEFLRAVIMDVRRLRRIDERYIFTLGWSSSGHVLYSTAAAEPAVRGSLIAMSRFLPERFASLDAMWGKSFFLYHSPEDQICPFAEAQLAERKLKEHGARVKLVSYEGGHGWVPNTFYCDRIHEGIEWLKNDTNEPSDATNRSQPVSKLSGSAWTRTNSDSRPLRRKTTSPGRSFLTPPAGKTSWPSSMASAVCPTISFWMAKGRSWGGTCAARSWRTHCCLHCATRHHKGRTRTRWSARSNTDRMTQRATED